MSYTPGWYALWCEVQSLNADRPDRWPEDAKQAFMAEKLARFRIHWAWMTKIGQPEIIRQQSGRDELIRQVRRELDDALSPCPTQGPYTGPHRPTMPRLRGSERPSVPPWREIPIEDVLAWVEAKPDRIGMSQTSARCLYWLEKEFGSKVPA